VSDGYQGNVQTLHGMRLRVLQHRSASWPHRMQHSTGLILGCNRGRGIFPAAFRALAAAARNIDRRRRRATAAWSELIVMLRDLATEHRVAD